MNANTYLWQLPQGWHARLSSSKQKFYFWNESNPKKTQWHPPKQDLEYEATMIRVVQSPLYQSLMTFCKEAIFLCTFPMFDSKKTLAIGQTLDVMKSCQHMKTFRDFSTCLNSSYALVTCWEGFESLADTRETLGLLSNRLEANGHLVLCLQNPFVSTVCDSAEGFSIVKVASVPAWMTELGYMQWTEDKETQRTREIVHNLQQRKYSMDAKDWSSLHHWIFASGFSIVILQKQGLTEESSTRLHLTVSGGS